MLLHPYKRLGLLFSKKNVPLSKVFKEIEEKTDCSFLIRNNDVNTNEKVSIDAKNKTVAEILGILFDGKGIKYEVNGKRISVYKAVRQHTIGGKRKVTGQVTDNMEEAVIGASVFVMGASNGTITDMNGHFSLELPDDNAKLQVSYIGYKTQVINVGNKSSVNIVLVEDSKALEEVVVVGYGTQKKVNLTGAVETVKSDRLANKPVTSIASALTGEAAGVTVTQNSGQPGPNQGTVRVRGIGTWGDASPLVLVDGVSMSLNDVIPSEVESVSVLKDAASAAIYGSRAANGVILITTKKGKEGKLTFNYSGNVGFQFATRVPESVTSWQYAELYNQMQYNEGKSSSLFPQDRIDRMKAGGDPDKLEGNTDWYDELLRSGAPQHNHQLTVSGGSDKITYMISAGYSDQQGIIPSTDYERYNLRVNTTSKLTSWLKLDVNMAYLNSTQEESAAGAAEAYRRTMRALPYLPVQFSDGTYSYDAAPSNPVRMVNGDYGMRRKNNDCMTLLIAPEINILDGLNIRGTFGYESNIYKEKIFNETVTYGSFEPAGQSGLTEVSRNKQTDRWDQYRNLTANVTASYEKTIGKHDFKVMAGGSLETFKWAYTKASRMDFPNDDFGEINAGDATTAAAEGNSTYSALASLFGRANYVYADRYLFEFTARYDGSSKFARGHRWGFFPSVSAGWRISEEAFFEPLKKHVQNLKLRASWGELGNQRINDYQFISNVGNGGSYLFGGTPIIGYKEALMGNEIITWESSRNLDFGIDFALFDNRLQTTFDWYCRTTSDILLNLEAPGALGIKPAMENAGKMENKGWDLTVSWRSNIGKDFKYNIGFNLSDVKNKVIDLRGYKSSTTELTAKIEGQPLNAIFGFETLGICDNQELYDKYAPMMQKYNPKWGDG
ncbi:TonB-dependent receptor [Bacteroides fragilis]|nr:TonB-dependent receptor [Bacteroides fragilis]